MVGSDEFPFGSLPIFRGYVSFRDTLSPIIMEVENGGLEDEFSLLLGTILHFHDYGRKGMIFPS